MFADHSSYDPLLLRTTNYSKYSKTSNVFLFLFPNKMLVFRAGIQKTLVRKANWEDPDQTASSKAV